MLKVVKRGHKEFSCQLSCVSVFKSGYISKNGDNSISVLIASLNGLIFTYNECLNEEVFPSFDTKTDLLREVRPFSITDTGNELLTISANRDGMFCFILNNKIFKRQNVGTSITSTAFVDLDGTVFTNFFRD